MTTEEKTALLAAGEEDLGVLEKYMEQALRRKYFVRAWDYHSQYAGAAFMLNVLGFISYEDYEARINTSFYRFLAAKYPAVSKEETV